MFTGLSPDLGRIVGADRIRRRGAAHGRRRRSAGELAEGDSVAVNGVCLTATAVGDRLVQRRGDERDAAAQLAGGRRRRAPVNLELPLRASDRLGGHVVQGHVDGVGDDRSDRATTASRGGSRSRPPAELLRYVVHKGSIARRRSLADRRRGWTTDRLPFL